MKDRIGDLVRKYEMLSHPEGGFYKETYRSNRQVILDGETYPAGTDIFYLLRNFKHLGDFSAWHKLKGVDETWFFHEGRDLTIYMIDLEGKLAKLILGQSEAANYQIHIPRDTWFSAVVEGDDPSGYCLVSCAVFPGFDFKCFELADRDKLGHEFPQYQEIIERLTRKGHLTKNTLSSPA